MNPIERFKAWFLEAKGLGLVNPDAMALASASREGKPSCRFVLLKQFDERGFVFFTNYQSRKSEELTANSFAAATFYWDALQKQIRIEGRVQKTSPEESRAYFISRPRTSQLGAWASKQSSVIPSREFLEARVEELAKKYQGADVPIPDFWGGWRLVPEQIEFWQGRANRLHDRIRFVKDGDNWREERLSP